MHSLQLIRCMPYKKAINIAKSSFYALNYPKVPRTNPIEIEQMEMERVSNSWDAVVQFVWETVKPHSMYHVPSISLYPVIFFCSYFLAPNWKFNQENMEELGFIPFDHST